MQDIWTFSGAWLSPALPQVTHRASTHLCKQSSPGGIFHLAHGYEETDEEMKRQFMCILQKFSHELTMCCALLCPASCHVHPASHKATVLPPGFPGTLGLPTLLEPPERPRGR